jgi:hypothetical protein
MQFNNPKEMRPKMRTLPVKNSLSHAPLRRGVLLVPFALAWFALSPTAPAVSPPDGAYAGGNTAEGFDALFSLTTGGSNTAIGDDALFHNTTGSDNTANGTSALFSNTTAGYNTANGFQVLFSNTTGSANTANGFQALLHNTTASFNTANGFGALLKNNGNANTATGYEALFSNMTGIDNTANGVNALFSNTSGNYNTATGTGALKLNTTGTENTANGMRALYNNTTGNLNIVLGGSAGQNLTTGSNNIDISNPGVAAESNIIRIGNEVAFTDTFSVVHPAHTTTFIAGIHGATASGGAAVFVNSSGELGTLTSSARFKDEIKPMDRASEAILALKPVTFRYKHELDPKGIPQFGLVAEDVEKVNPDLIARDAEGKVYTVRYEAVNAMLLNEFLKEHRKMEEQEATIAQLKKGMEVLTASLKEQASQIQKVSDKVEMNKPAPRTVENNQ